MTLDTHNFPGLNIYIKKILYGSSCVVQWKQIRILVSMRLQV